MPNGELQVTIGAATSHIVASMYETAQKRGDNRVRYIKSPQGFVEFLLDFACTRLSSEYKSRDQYEVGKTLRIALDKLVNAKPLSSEETKLVAAFRQASQPANGAGTQNAATEKP